ncbi:unnamed protein product [Acanthoscelides obtectus]|uniref:Uncharacterized protein n=1 Tax=Acanthoscelides obtectus TaxID=200917 RepID=A0A9P0NRI5_ACAOB|nr:unnamed protein product [Acanthoscelides obtectus]CAK1665610.1 hypothetical protein AOBTE_LOCUS24897 [Acanthoscelides obtectus]
MIAVYVFLSLDLFYLKHDIQSRHRHYVDPDLQERQILYDCLLPERMLLLHHLLHGSAVCAAELERCQRCRRKEI